MRPQSVEVSPSWRRTLTVDGVTHRAAMDFELTAEDYEKAFRELGETEELRQKTLNTLRGRLLGDGELNWRPDEDFLLRFLRFKKFDSDKAYALTRHVLLTRIKRPDLFALPANLRALLDLNFCRWTPYRSEEGCVIFDVQFKNWRLKEMSLVDMISLVNAQADILCSNPVMQIHGTICVYNMEGVTTDHVAHIMRPQNLLALSTLVQALHPWRIIKVVLINTNAFVRASYRAVSWVLQKKLRERIVLLGSDLTELHQHVQPRLLPKAYGGNLDEDECSVTEVVMKNLPYLEYLRGFGVAEKCESVETPVESESH